MKYIIKLNISGEIEKMVEADSVEEAEELAQDWWDEMDAYTITDHVSVDEIDVRNA